MEEILPEQKNQLKTWAGQRDAILLEISNLQVTKEKLQIDNIALSSSNTDIVDRMNQIIGRIEELNKKEKESVLLISKEVANLDSRKTCLETEIKNLEQIIKILSPQKESLEKDIISLTEVFYTINDRASVLDKVVDHVTVVSNANVKIVDELVNNLKNSLEEIVEINKKNVFETNVVIEKLPKMLVEAQKHGLIKNKI